jgi:hypothetical protein
VSSPIERASFLDCLHKLGDDEAVEELGMWFALYEKELLDQVQFLRGRLQWLAEAKASDPALYAAEALRELDSRFDY